MYKSDLPTRLGTELFPQTTFQPGAVQISLVLSRPQEGNVRYAYEGIAAQIIAHHAGDLNAFFVGQRSFMRNGIVKQHFSQRDLNAHLSAIYVYSFGLEWMRIIVRPEKYKTRGGASIAIFHSGNKVTCIDLDDRLNATVRLSKTCSSSSWGDEILPTSQYRFKDQEGTWVLWPLSVDDGLVSVSQYYHCTRTTGTNTIANSLQTTMRATWVDGEHLAEPLMNGTASVLYTPRETFAVSEDGTLSVVATRDYIGGYAIEDDGTLHHYGMCVGEYAIYTSTEYTGSSTGNLTDIAQKMSDYIQPYYIDDVGNFYEELSAAIFQGVNGSVAVQAAIHVWANAGGTWVLSRAAQSLTYKHKFNRVKCVGGYNEIDLMEDEPFVAFKELYDEAGSVLSEVHTKSTYRGVTYDFADPQSGTPGWRAYTIIKALTFPPAYNSEGYVTYPDPNYSIRLDTLYGDWLTGYYPTKFNVVTPYTTHQYDGVPLVDSERGILKEELDAISWFWGVRSHLETLQLEPRKFFRGWLSVSDGTHIIQGYKLGEQNYAYYDGQDFAGVLGSVGVDINGVQSILFDVPLEFVDNLA